MPNVLLYSVVVHLVCYNNSVRQLKWDLVALVAYLILAIGSLCRAGHQYHITRLLQQLLRDAGLTLSWKEVILPLVIKVSETVSELAGYHYVKRLRNTAAEIETSSWIICTPVKSQ